MMGNTVIAIQRALNVTHKLKGEDIRIGIFIDRAEGKAAAILLNANNNKFAFLTRGEHKIKTDDFDGLFDVVNEVCDDIQRWSEENK